MFEKVVDKHTKTGKVTAGTTAGTATVKATYNGLEDSVQITIVK